MRITASDVWCQKGSEIWLFIIEWTRSRARVACDFPFYIIRWLAARKSAQQNSVRYWHMWGSGHGSEQHQIYIIRTIDWNWLKPISSTKNEMKSYDLDPSIFHLWHSVSIPWSWVSLVNGHFLLPKVDKFEWVCENDIQLRRSMCQNQSLRMKNALSVHTLLKRDHKTHVFKWLTLHLKIHVQSFETLHNSFLHFCKRMTSFNSPNSSREWAHTIYIKIKYRISNKICASCVCVCTSVT